MKIVLDTNVLVSGLLSPYHAPGEIVRMSSLGILQVCYDARVLSEYKHVLARPKFGFNSEYAGHLLEQIKACGHTIVSEPLPKRLPDSSDEPFLEIAVRAKAMCLITGNLKHYPPSLRFGMRVLLPQDFLEFYGSQQ